MEEYYEKPEWIKGNIYQTLEEAGNYSIFLKGIELSGNRQMVDGKSILTVMAPNDEAFTRYLQENYGTKEIEDLPLTEIKKLIGFHIMYYAYGTDRMLNYRPFEGDDATKEEKEVLAGMYYKHRTKSSDLPFVEWSEDWRDSVMVYPLERHLPVFSYNFFNTKQIDAAYNYEYFFPETQWKGGNSGFNISNAAVELGEDGKYEVIASNGYIYKVDKVLRPLETIYKELTSRASEFSDFLEMYDRTKSYVPNNDLTLQYGNGRTLYLIDHYPLPNIAQEWYSPIHYNVALNSSVSFSLFAPTNRALANFFDDYWKVGGYESLQEVSSASMNYLLLNSIYQPKQIEKAQVIFPEEIKKGEVESSLGTVVSFDVDAVPAENRIMCLNGSLYGCEVLATPAIFGAITGPAFQYKKFGHYLQMLTNNGNDS
ncbi:fasciclin, partial [Bacteroidales bacterium OttesenSCG-928-L03]|nr:fasciclin [Bacteroidales bacterium OttesenSCG-928-L03]